MRLISPCATTASPSQFLHLHLAFDYPPARDGTLNPPFSHSMSGVAVCMAGSVGHDFFGGFALGALKNNNVNIDFVRQV